MGLARRFALLAAIPLASAAAPAQRPEMPEWLAGGWAMQSESGSWSEEWWTPPKAGLMLGAGRSGKGDSLGWWEQTRIQLDSGKLSFCALPKGQKEACFAATSSSDSGVVFENPAHDFPTRIEYRRQGDELYAEISGPDGANRQRWRFRKIA